MKKHTAYLLTALILFLVSCEKRNGKDLNFDHQFTAQAVLYNYNLDFETSVNSNGLKFTRLENFSILDSTSLISSLLDSYGYSNLYNPSDTIVGLIIYLSDTIDVNDYNSISSLNPAAILLYQKDNEYIYTKYFTNEMIDSGLSCYTSHISTSDIIDIDIVKELRSKEILSFVNFLKVNKNDIYTSELQISIEKHFEDLEFAASKTGCSAANNPYCNNMLEDYVCVPKEINNIVQDNCEKRKPSNICFSETTGPELAASYSYTPPAGTKDKLYNIRDIIMTKTDKGKRYIDDYYYLSDKISAIGYPTDYYLKLINLYQSNILDKMGNLYNQSYSDSILINIDNKNDIIYILNQIKIRYSNDGRIVNIMNKLENDVILYSNKTIITILNEL